LIRQVSEIDQGPDGLKTKRKMRVVNIAALIASVGFAFTAILQFQLGPDWRYLAFANLGLGLAALFTLALDRFGLEIKVAYFTLWLFIFLVHDVTGGKNGEDHLVLLVGPPLLFYFLGTTYWRWITAITLVSAALYVFISLYVPAHVTSDTSFVETVILPLRDNWRLQPEDLIFVVLIFGIVAALYFTSYSANAAVEQYETALEQEIALSDRLIRILLPVRIIERLKADPEKMVAERCEKATILFADLSGFSEYSAANGARATVSLLDAIFSEFDHLVADRQLEKIKTIGDSYMVAGGLDTSSEHTESLSFQVATLALDMIATVDRLSQGLTPKISLRVGIHTGPVIAGVIGGDRPFFDVWGDTVNVASRMESTGEPGRVQISPEFHNEIAKLMECEERETFEIKGIGPIKPFWLLGIREATLDENARLTIVDSPRGGT